MALIVASTPLDASSNTEFSPFFSIKETLLDESTVTGDDSGSITTFAPGINVLRDGPQSTLRFDYRLNIIEPHGLDRENREIQELDLFANREHSPGRWESSIRAQSRLISRDIDSRQNVNLEFAGENDRELRVVEANTRLNNKLTDTVQYLTRLSVDYTDVEDEDYTDGYGIVFQLDNFPTQNPFTWRTRLRNRVSRDDESETRVDEALVELDYRLNRRWSSFINFSSTDTDTDFDELDEDEYLLGVNWTPSPRTSVTVGFGEREVDQEESDTYRLDALYGRQHFSLVASYSEVVTTPRGDLLDQLQDDFSSQRTTDDVGIEPVLQKRTALRFRVNGKNTDIVTTVFEVDRSGQNSVREDENTKGLRATYSRRMSPRGTFGVELFIEETRSAEDNELGSLSVFYSWLRSGNETLVFEIGREEQTSTDAANEFERNFLSAEYSIRF